MFPFQLDSQSAVRGIDSCLVILVSVLIAHPAAAGIRHVPADVQTDCNDQTCVLKLTTNSTRGQSSIQSNPMYIHFSRNFGTEKCDFFNSRKTDLTAYVSICETNGRKEVEGVMYTSDFKIVVHPNAVGYDVIMLWPTASMSVNGSRSVHETRSRCLSEGKSTLPYHSNRQSSIRSEEALLELFVAGDHFLVEKFKGNRLRAEKYGYQVANGVATFLQQLDLKVEIVGFGFISEQESNKWLDAATVPAVQFCKNITGPCVEPQKLFEYGKEAHRFNDRDEFPVGGVDTQIGRPDASLVISGLGSLGTVYSGLAPIGQMCDEFATAVVWPYSVFVQEDTLDYRRLHIGAMVAAHELAHVIGLGHVTDFKLCPDCLSGNDWCIMYHYQPHNAYLDRWSSCSRTAVKNAIEQPEVYNKTCLFTHDVDRKFTSRSQKSGSDVLHTDVMIAVTVSAGMSLLSVVRL